jgi:hypothetical protein
LLILAKKFAGCQGKGNDKPAKNSKTNKRNAKKI